MRKMSDQHDWLRLARQRVDDPICGVCGLQTASRGKRRERIAPLQVGLGGLSRAQLAAVPDDVGFCAALGGLLGEHVHLDAAPIRERPHRIHVGADRVAMVGKEQHELRLLIARFENEALEHRRIRQVGPEFHRLEPA